jgi:tetratricopeptide (TPR) repeat protein
MASNHPYYYLYYNQFAGGLKGAYGNYETDYYYHTMREGAKWLKEYLKNEPRKSELTIGGNFPIQWYFRDDKALKMVYFPYQNRSEYNWDYAVIANTYISPFQLKKKLWPPANTIHTIYADGIPVCAVIERLTKDDLHGIEAYEKGDSIKSALLFQNAHTIDPQNELICYKFAESLIGSDRSKEAEQVLKKALEINPDYEKTLTLLGDLALKNKDTLTATGYYEQTIRSNRKYFEAYIKLADLWTETNTDKARKVLRDCLRLNSRYQPALSALADTYRKTDPKMVLKYDELINKLK